MHPTTPGRTSPIPIIYFDFSTSNSSCHLSTFTHARKANVTLYRGIDHLELSPCKHKGDLLALSLSYHIRSSEKRERGKVSERERERDRCLRVSHGLQARRTVKMHLPEKLRG